MVSAATEFRKNSYGDEESANLARVASLLQNVADEEMSAGDAASFLIAQMKSFNLSAEDAITIVDQVNAVSNNFAVSSGDLSNNLGLVASTSAAVGNSMSETLAMMTAISEQTRSASKAARGLNSIFSRYSQILDEESSTGKKLIEIFEGLNIALFDQEGQIRSTYDILSDLAGKWQGLSKNEQEYIALTSAGANQLNNFLALMNGFNTALDANKVALNSAGSAVQENEKYMGSLAAKVSQFKSAWEALSNSVVNSDLVKGVINLGTGVLKILNTDLGVMFTQLGLLTGVLTGGISLLSKFVTNIGTGVLALKNLSTATIAATEAGASFKLVMAGISGLAPVVAVALAAIIIAIAGVTTAISDYSKHLKEVNQYAKELNDTFKESDKTYKESQDSIEGTTILLTKYTNRLDVLNKKLEANKSYTKLTAAEQIELKNIINTLNEKIPGLNLKIDETTRKLNKQTKEIYDQIEAWKELSLTDAYQSSVQSKKKAYEDTQVELATLQAKQRRLETERAAMIEQYGAKITLGATGGALDWAYNNFLGIPDEAVKKFWEIEQELRILPQTIEATNKALDKNKQEYKDATSAAQAYENAQSSQTRKTKRSSAMAVEFGGGKAPGASHAQEEPFYQFNYSDWLDKQQHALAMGEIQEADYYASLEFMLNKWTDESIISTKERWRAEESIYKYKKELSEQEQKDYEKKLKAQQTASKASTKSSYDDAKAQTTAYKQAFTDWLDEKEYLLNTDQITEQEYYDALKAKNEEYYGGKSEYLSEYRKYAEIVYKWEKKQNDEIAKAAKQAHEDEFDSWLAKMEHALAMGEISEEDYYERLKEMSDEYFKGDEEYLEKYWKYEEQYYSWKQKQIETAAEAEKKAQEEALERQKEKLKLQQQELQTEQDNLNAVISYAQKYSQKQIDDIDERINKLKDEANAIKDNYQDQIDKLKETNEALDDQIEKQKLLEALAKAQQTKKYVFKDGRFQYVDDVDAITSAQEALDNFNRQQSLNERVALLEKQRDAELASNEAAQKALEQQKQRWQDYKDGWANLTDEYEYNQNELLALEQYGIDFEKATWDERIANLNDFKERYAQNVKDLEKLAARLNSLETSGSSSGTIQTATKVDPDQAILDEMKANSQAWWFASTDKEREAIHKRNVELNEMLSKKGTYDPGSGKWSHYAKGTTSARGGLSLVGEKGAELRVLNKGDGVVPAHMTENLMDWGTQKPNDFVNKMLNKGKEMLSNVINVGNVSLPNVQNAKEFVSELKNLAYQAAYSRT